MYSDILITPIEQYDADPGEDPLWANKRKNKMLWRGSTTGSRYDRATLWRPSQRSRLNMRASRPLVRKQSEVIKHSYQRQKGLEIATVGRQNERRSANSPRRRHDRAQ